MKEARGGVERQEPLTLVACLLLKQAGSLPGFRVLGGNKFQMSVVSEANHAWPGSAIKMRLSKYRTRHGTVVLKAT